MRTHDLKLQKVGSVKRCTEESSPTSSLTPSVSYLQTKLTWRPRTSSNLICGRDVEDRQSYGESLSLRHEQIAGPCNVRRANRDRRAHGKLGKLQTMPPLMLYKTRPHMTGVNAYMSHAPTLAAKRFCMYQRCFQVMLQGDLFRKSLVLVGGGAWSSHPLIDTGSTHFVLLQVMTIDTEVFHNKPACKSKHIFKKIALEAITTHDSCHPAPQEDRMHA